MNKKGFKLGALFTSKNGDTDIKKNISMVKVFLLLVQEMTTQAYLVAVTSKHMLFRRIRSPLICLAMHIIVILIIKWLHMHEYLLCCLMGFRLMKKQACTL